MNIPLIPMIVAAISTFAAILLIRPFAISIDLVDRPNNRKKHYGSVPLIGGLAMFFGIVISIIVLTFDLNQYDYFLISSLIIVTIGVLDDHQNISVSLRLVFQILAALIIVTVGDSSIQSLGNLLGSGDILLYKWTYFISVLALICGMNAINMSDGIHGLAGGTSLVTFLSILYLSIGSIFEKHILIAFLFCAVLPIFLIDNLCIGISKRHRIFMGDAGSMFIGLVIAWLLINLSQGENRAFEPVTALWIFALPLFEIFATTFRRVTSKKSIFKPDLNHSHHILIRLGFRQKTTLTILISFSISLALIGILGEQYQIDTWIMFYGFLLTFLLYIISFKLVLRKFKNGS